MKKFLFSVVTACYNTARYLDAYFASLTGDASFFKTHIELICVDDGSTDNTAELIGRWQKQYPENISYVYQENAGAGAARNAGLKKARGTWITCIDSDDFLDGKYFKEIYSKLALSENSRVRLIICKPIAYFEATKTRKDSHPLNFRFEGEPRFTLTRSTPFIHVLTNSAFLHTETLHRNALLFDTRVVPTFEDGDLLMRYMRCMENHDVLLVKNALYFARKRVDESSLYSGALKKRGFYTDSLEYGMLKNLVRTEQEPVLPRYVQDTILFAVRQVLRRVEGAAQSGFSPDSIEPGLLNAFYDTIIKIVSSIDSDVIKNPYYPDFGFDVQFLFIEQIKKESSSCNNVTILKMDVARKRMLVSYLSTSPDYQLSFSTGDKQAVVIAQKRVGKSFLRFPYYEHRVWLGYANESETLSVQSPFPEQQIQIIAGSGKYTSSAHIDRLVTDFFHCESGKLSKGARFLKALALTRLVKNTYKDSWVFCDSRERADDNAEHMYRYMQKAHPEVRCFFILGKHSPDWNRLEQEGFRLIPYNSLRHKFALIHCKYLLSSQAHKVLARWSRNIARYKFIYFGHGVIKDDLSHWHNTFSIDLSTRVTRQEFDYITRDDSPYALTKEEVVITGFPRHDALLQKNIAQERMILFSPTWRFSLAKTGPDRRRSCDPLFGQSRYAQAIHALITSPELTAILEEYDYSFVFVPHPNMQQYADFFTTPPRVKLATEKEFGGFQTLFKKTRIFITDYSSMAFDVAMLKKAVLYYHFDAGSIFSGEHTTRKGYFDYVKDGFGPVCTTQKELLDALKLSVMQNGAMQPEYEQRVLNTFVYLDENNCERVYESVKALEGTDVALQR